MISNDRAETPTIKITRYVTRKELTLLIFFDGIELVHAQQ